MLARNLHLGLLGSKQQSMSGLLVDKTVSTRSARRSAAPRYNPQNVDDPQVLPSPEYSAEQAVCIQLEALQRNDSPWVNHGIQTAYCWALDVGGLDPSWYFGFKKDLYHQDHFSGMFANQLGELVNCASFRVLGVLEPTAPQLCGGHAITHIVDVEVQGLRQHQQQAAAVYEFHLARKSVGARKGSLMTCIVVRKA